MFSRSLCRVAAAGAILLAVAFAPDEALASENQIHLPQGVDSSSNQGSRSAPGSPAGSRTERSVNTAFPSGTWNVYAYGAAAVGKTSRKVYAGNIGLGYHLIDNLSLNLEGGGYFIDHARDTGGGGVDMLLRWHPLRGPDWSLYLDGGPGFIYSRRTLRDPGTHFNFTVQGGAGATHRLTDHLHSMAGMRWFHISNARIRGKNRNVGFDSPMFYLGLMRPF